MRVCNLMILCAVAALLASRPGSAHAVPPPPCPIPAAFTNAPPAMQAAAQGIRAQKRLTIYAVGSATMFGPGIDAPEDAFPYRMADALGTALPEVAVSITTAGGRATTAGQMLDLMRAALAHPQGSAPITLVIWQTGTVEAVQHASPQEFSRTLAQGAALAREYAASLVVVDAQYSRFLHSHTTLGPYEAAMRAAALLPGVILFRRYDLMRRWAGSGEIDLERANAPNRARIAAELHACLGAALAQLVLHQIAASP